MKEKDGYVDCPEQQMILYVEKGDGKYGPLQTGSYITANYLDDYFLKREHLIASLKEKVVRGEISPIHYYLTLEELTISELAARVGLWRWTVRRHLMPKHFLKIKECILRKYAVVFNVSVDELRSMTGLKNEDRKA